MEEKFEVVYGTDSCGCIELPFTYDMLWYEVNEFLGNDDIDESVLNVVQKDFRKKLRALSDDVVMGYLKEWFYEKEDKDWLSELNWEDKLRWVVTLIEKDLQEELWSEEVWKEYCQPFEVSLSDCELCF